MTHHRFPLLIVLAFAILAFAILPVRATAAAEAPNIVMIISDDQAWTDYSLMGHEHIRTPNLDRLASQSLVFTRGYVPDSLCRPSLATLATGLYPHQHGVVGNDPARGSAASPSGRTVDSKYRRENQALIDRFGKLETLPKLLARQGYLSHQSGKWWEGRFSNGGFTHGMTQGFPNPGGRHGDQGLSIGREGLGPVTDFVDMAVAQGKPFFVWYAPFLPHTPHNPPQRLLEKYRDKTPHLPIAKYWAMCEWFDETVGGLLGHLDKRGLAENTVVLYVTDNGWINAEDASRYAPKSKRSQYDGGIRTPIMVRWPGRVTPKMDKTTLASSIDLVPTALAAAGLKPAADMQGVNLLDADAVSRRQRVFGEIFLHDIRSLDEPAKSLTHRWVIDGWWKLIVPHKPNQPGGEVELYDLEADPHETRNLAGEHEDRVGTLRAVLDGFWRVEPSACSAPSIGQ